MTIATHKVEPQCLLGRSSLWLLGRKQLKARSTSLEKFKSDFRLVKDFYQQERGG